VFDGAHAGAYRPRHSLGGGRMGDDPPTGALPTSTTSRSSCSV
jgi:hypothetical protein